MLHRTSALLVLVAVGAAPPIQLPDALRAPSCVACNMPDARRLPNDEIVVSEIDDPGSEADGRGTVEVIGIVARPPARVWSVLVDFVGRPSWQPGATSVAIARLDGDRVWVDEHERFFLVDIRYRLLQTLDPEHGEIRFVLDDSADHSIAGTTGCWRLQPTADGRATIVTYRARIDLGRYVPASVQAFLVKRSLPSLLERLRDETLRRFDAGE